jgi:hypothetical protein
VLNEKGLVRRIDTPQDVARRVWEIAHDFIAQLLFIILRTQRASMWSRLRLALAPLTLVLWAAMFIYLRHYVDREPERTADVLQRNYAFFCRPTPEGYDIDVRDKKITSLEPMSPFLKQLRRVRKLDFSECRILASVDELKELTSLQSLDLSKCDSLTNVGGLKGLTALRSLNLARCSVLSNVEALEGLTTLQSLDLSYCSGLTDAGRLHGPLPGT